MKSNYMNYFKDRNLYQWDKDNNIFTITPLSVEEEFCLDQKGMDMFLKFYNPNGMLPVITLGKTLQVKLGKQKASIKICDTTLSIPNLDFTNEFSVDIDKLKIAVKFVDETGRKPILTGVNVNNDCILSTDSFNAYRVVLKNDCNITLAPQFINELSAFKGIINIKCNNNLVCYENEGVRIIGRLLDGKYPCLDKVFNSVPNDTSFEITKSDLQKILSYSTNKNDYVILKNDKIIIEGENTFETEIELPLGDIKIKLVLERLQNVVKAIQDEKLIIRYSDGIHPVLVNNDFMILPVNTQ